MQRVHVFLNKYASQGDRDSFTDEIKKELYRSDLKFITPEKVEEYREKIKEAREQGVDVVISVGGDGTVNLSIQELVGGKTSFLIIPAGTANDLAKELGLDLTVGKSVRTIRQMRPRPIDLINLAAIGFLSPITMLLLIPYQVSMLSAICKRTKRININSHALLVISLLSRRQAIAFT